MMRVIVVGYGPGGASAAVAAKMFNTSAQVTILTSETSDAHRKPGASMALEFPDTDELVIDDWSFDSLKKKKIEVLLGSKVVDGDTKSKTLKYVDAKGKEKEISYDRLILATGGVPSVPDLPGVDLQGVYTVQDKPGAALIGANLDGVERVIIVGAGFSGLEIAEKLHRLGKDVHLVVRSRLMRRLMEPPMSEELQNRISDHITLHTGKSPTHVIGSKSVEGISLGDEEIQGDTVLFMTGVKPNTALAKSLGVELGSTGGISVNSTMETSVDSIYAVGDCIELMDPLTSEPTLMPIGSTAARAGRQAGVAAVGGRKVYDDLTLRLQYDRIFNIDIVCLGHSTVTAKDRDLNPKVQYLEDSAEFSKVALVTDKDDRLIGGQVIASRMGARVGYQIYNRILAGAKLAEQPLLESTHKRMRDLIENMFGPIE
jgi:NADH oxidase (H2O2-forming)